MKTFFFLIVHFVKLHELLGVQIPAVTSVLFNVKSVMSVPISGQPITHQKEREREREREGEREREISVKLFFKYA
mgnify:CR=1 FL=1